VDEIGSLFSDLEEVDYVMTNFASTFTEQSLKYERLSKDNSKIHDQDIKDCLNVTKYIFGYLSASFKKWGKYLLITSIRR
jgi:hypothetical protein